MNAHAKFSPSAAHIWLRCGLYVRMVEMFPRTSTPAAEEGTRLHDIAAKALEAGEFESEEPVLNSYFDLIRKILDEKPRHFYIEKKVRIFEDCSGTADAVAVGDDWLDVVDLKTGKSPVQARENPQLVLYALGFLDLHPLPDDARVRLIIEQPRSTAKSPINEWVTTAGEILSRKPMFLKAAERAHRSPPVTMAGHHCWFCPAKLYCREYKIHQASK